MATTTIYLSSTYDDLQDYRRAVYELLRKSDYHVIAMEDYVATDQRPVEKCLKDVEEADIYVGMFAFRYGYVPPPEHQNANRLSITELELRQAEKLKKHCLTFVVKDTTAWPRIFDDAHTSEDKGERIKALRHYLLTEKTAGLFSQAHELAGLVVAAVTRHLDQKKQPESADGHVPATQVAATWDIKEKGSPYPGLLHFTRKYAPVFFGRDAEVREILDRMRSSEGRFILVSGNSGVGKSSVVAAGVLPLIEETPLPGSTRCLCVRMVPSKGPHPFSALMGALHSSSTAAGLDPDSMEKDLIQSPQRLAHHVRDLLSKGGEYDALVLFLDQMEELFTSQDPKATELFLAALYQTAQEGALWVLATIRSDHLHHCHGHPDMLRLLRGKGHYPVGPIEPFMLSDLIAKPARCAGLGIGEKLVRRIAHEAVAKVDDAKGTGQSNLPLLAFVLNQLFEKRQDQELSESVYERLGGITGAIAHHAATVEHTIRQKHGAATAALLPTLFRSLVIVGGEGIPTRRRPLTSDIDSAMTALLDTLVHERLLHTEGEGKAATVSISHEALFEAWPSLREYVAKNSKQLMDQTLLDSRARKWEQMGKPWFSGLPYGREYWDFRRAEISDSVLTKEYLRASQRKGWIQISVIVLTILLLVSSGYWLWREGLTIEQAILKIKSEFVSIHVEPKMQKVASGSFRRGNMGNPSEQPIHEVTIKPFAIGQYEVTFEEYDRFAITTGHPLLSDYGLGRGRRPVINVSWNDARDYAAWLSQQTGKRYRLPTEAEWEYAARNAGNVDIWAGTSDENQLEDYAVYLGNSKIRTTPVGEKKPNGLGLYDMSGNVWEWVQDCWHDDYRGSPTDGSAWLHTDGGHCSRRVIRGGSWANESEFLRSSNRNRLHAVIRINDIGFRLAQDIP